MAMNLTSSNWESKTTVKKGNIGENLTKQYLRNQGYIIYSPETEGKHPFDTLIVTPDKKKIGVGEIKTKPKRRCYPDTGIDLRHYNDYISVQNNYNIEVYIFFVDEESKTIYGNTLNKLLAPREVFIRGQHFIYPLTQYGIIYFHIDNTIVIATISDKDASEISKLTTHRAGGQHA